MDNEQDHVQHACEVLQQLLANNLFVKAIFIVNSFLGFVVAEGLV